MQLTPEQKQLAEQHIHLAGYIARQFSCRTPLDYDELFSICSEGLCHAAVAYNPLKGQFSTIACIVMKRFVFNQLRSSRQEIPYENIGNYSPAVDTFPSAEVIDMQMAIPHVLRNFKGTQREKAVAITLVRNPDLTQVEIANRTGVSQKTVSTAINNFRKQLQNAV